MSPSLATSHGRPEVDTGTDFLGHLVSVVCRFVADTRLIVIQNKGYIALKSDRTAACKGINTNVVQISIHYT